MSEPTDDTIVERGQKRIIAYAIRPNGKSPARDFLETEVDDRDLAALDRSFVAMARIGKSTTERSFKKSKEESGSSSVTKCVLAHSNRGASGI